MKLQRDSNPVTITGTKSAPTSFRIAASGAAFKTLSSGLYNNKIRAIIRELSCNAYDAHVAAGKADQPFTVHLPTGFEPFFTVKDQGTGLKFIEKGCKVFTSEGIKETCYGTGKIKVQVGDHEEEVVCEHCDGTGDYDAVKLLMTTYFATDKDDSDLFIGALGLGSKSPFCYTEGFSVVNTYQGYTRVYSCFLDKGMPAVLLQTVEETPDKTNGVEVSFPVKQSDVWAFHNQAQAAWEFFLPRPEHNVPELAIDRAEYHIRTENWGLRKDGGKPRAIQGFVQYDLGEIDESRLNNEQRKLLQLPLDLFFSIGELEVAASREALSNDERTVQNILNKLTGIKDELLKDTREKIMACENLWEAKLLIYNLSNQATIGPMISQAFQAGEFANLNPNFSLNNNDLSIDQKDFPGLTVKEFSRTWHDRAQARIAFLTNEKIEPGTSHVIRFPVKKKMTFVINDVGFGTDKFIHYMLQRDRSESIDVVYLLTKRGKDVTDEALMDLAAKAIVDLGNPPWQLMSEVKTKYKDEMKESNPYVYIPKTVLKLEDWRYVSGTIAGWTRIWFDHSKKELPPGTKFYLPTKAGEPQTGVFSKARELTEFMALVREIPALGIGDKTIFGVPTWYVGKLDDSWVELTSYIHSKVLEVLTPEVKNQIAFHKQGFTSRIDASLNRIAKDKLLSPNSPLQQFSERWHAARSYNRTEIAKLCEFLSRPEFAEQNNFNAEVKFQDLWNRILKIYPLLNWVMDQHGNVTDALIQYVTLVDFDNEINRAFNIVEMAQPATEAVAEEIQHA